MKVLKFGGTSVGTIDSLKNVKAIVEQCTEPVIVVVSALGGITDQLINTAHLAAKGDIGYHEAYFVHVCADEYVGLVCVLCFCVGVYPCEHVAVYVGFNAVGQAVFV